MTEGNITSWYALDIFKGGKVSDGRMIMKGIASTPSMDLDGEKLNPTGYQLDYFIKSGFMNWDHQSNKDPETIIGRPTSNTKIENGKMEIEFELFKKSNLAKKVYNLSQTLAANGLQLGLSIEGKALEYGDEDKKVITKALVTGCAITPHPRNQETFAEIVKGLVSDDPEMGILFNKGGQEDNLSPKDGEDGEEDEEETKDGADTTGEPVTKDVDGVEKAITAESPSGKALTKESLKDEVVNPLSKGNIYKVLFDRYDWITPEQVGGVYSKLHLIEKSTTAMSDLKKQEALDSAIAALDTFQKGLSGAAVAEPAVETTAVETEEMPDDIEKGGHSDAEVLEASKAILESAGYEITKGGSFSSFDKTVEPSEDGISDIIKGSFADIQNGLNASIDTKIGETNNAVSNSIEIIKSLANDVKALNNAVTIIGSATPGLRAQTSGTIQKSFGTNQPTEELEGGSEAEIPEGTTVYSKTKHRAQIISKGLELAMDADGNVKNMNLANDIRSFEADGSVGSDLMKSLQAEKIVILG